MHTVDMKSAAQSCLFFDQVIIKGSNWNWQKTRLSSRRYRKENRLETCSTQDEAGRH